MRLGETLKRIIYGKGVTPLPLGITVTAFLFVLFSAMAITNVFSYLPKLVKEFNVSEVNTAKSVGAISSAMFGGRIASSFNVTWTIIARSLQGLAMGLIVITKAIISDVADNSNLAAGLSFIFSASNIGYIVGPSMSGYLVFPVEKYPKVFRKGSFFDLFKVLIPNFIIAVGLTVSLVVALFLLPKNKRNTLDVQEIPIDNVCQPCIENTDIVNGTKVFEKDVLLKKNRHLITSYYQKFKASKVGVLMSNKDFLISAMVYFVYSIYTVGFEELFPVFAATSIAYNGLGMSPSNIGLFYMVSGFAAIMTQFLITNKLINKYGAKKIFCYSIFIFALFAVYYPTNGLIKNRTFMWISLWITQCFTRSMFSTGVLCVNMFLNNSVDSHQRGLANGIGLSLASVGRSIGAASFGSAYSWSLNNVKLNKDRGFPLNEYFAFMLISVFAMFFLVFITRLPIRLNKKKCK